MLKLLPQIGSPFAMKYGGVETGGSATSFADVAGMLAGVANAAAAADGLQANFARRNEGWQNQKQLADYDVQVLTQQQTAAQIRVNIATNALALQQTTIDQTQEFLDCTRGKFTNLGLYTWLATTLQSFYRGAYQNALALANLAQQLSSSSAATTRPRPLAAVLECDVHGPARRRAAPAGPPGAGAPLHRDQLSHPRD